MQLDQYRDEIKEMVRNQYSALLEKKKKDKEEKDSKEKEPKDIDMDMSVDMSEPGMKGGDAFGNDDFTAHDAAPKRSTEGDSDEIYHSLKKALDASKALGNEKLTTQISNTIKFYVSDVITGKEDQQGVGMPGAGMMPSLEEMLGYKARPRRK